MLSGKKIVPDTSLLGKKLYQALKPIVPGGAKVLLHIQVAGYNFTTAPFSSRPGGYKGAIDRKKISPAVLRCPKVPPRYPKIPKGTKYFEKRKFPYS